MKGTFSLLFLLIAYGTNFAQNISFSYDKAGNRIKREIILQTKSASDKSSAEYYSEIISEKNIRIYPNPTEGFLKVEIIGLIKTDQCTFKVFNSSGQLIFLGSAASSSTELDISSRPNGIYILKISLNGKESIWKIIKQ